MLNNNIDVTDSEIRNIFKRLDIDRDNRINFNEFKRLFYNVLTSESKELMLNRSISNKNKRIYESPLRSKSQYGNKRLRNSNDLSDMYIEENNFSRNNYSLKNSYMSYEEENFVQFIKELLEIESNLEKAKISLIYKSDFNVEDVFRNFEIDGRGYITLLDLNHGLSAFDVFAPMEDIDLLMKRYDLKNEGILR